MKLLAPVLAAAALAAGGWLYLRPDALPEPPGGADAPADSTHAPGGRAAGAAPDTRMPPPLARGNPLALAAPAPVRATLFNDYLQAKQYRALYDRLNGSPEGATAEGRLVLYEILRECATITEGRRYVWRRPTPKREELVGAIAVTDPNRERRIAAYDQFTANRCVGFEGVALTQAELDRMLQDAAAAGDPRAKAMAIEQELWQARRTQGRGAATISDAQIETLKQIVATRDPEAIRVAGRVLSNSWADYSLRLGPDQAPVEPRAFMNAWLVLACEYGQPCGPETPRMQQACALRGHCDAQNYIDHLYHYGSTPHDSQLLVQYRGLLRQAIESGDWSQLSVVRGLPQAPNRVTFVPGPR